MTRDEILVEARRWLGTPYRHQASKHGVGCDCLGLLRGIWRSQFGCEPEIPPPYSMDWDEVGGQDLLRKAAERHLTERPMALMMPGDVLLFRMHRDSVAKHLGICSDLETARFIHSYSGHGVVESALTASWKRRIDGVFTFPGIVNSR